MSDAAANLYWVSVGIVNGLPGIQIAPKYILYPESYAVPILHFDAANTVTATAGLVDTWNDSSGYNRNAVQYSTVNRPTLLTAAVNGLKAVRFNGIGQFMTLSNFITGGNITVFIVAANQRASLNGSSIDTLVSTMPSGGVAGGIGLSTFNGYASTTQRQFSADYSGGTNNIWVNGSQASPNLVQSVYAVLTYQGTGVNARNQMYFGLYPDGNLPGTNDVAEIYIYQGILPAATRASMESSLKTKYAIP